MTDNYFKFEKNRDFGELFNDTFLFIKYNFKNLVLGIIYFVIPVALIQGIIMGIIQNKALSSLSSELSTNPFTRFDSNLLIFYLFAMITSMLLMTFIFQYMKLYKASEDKVIELKVVWQSMLKILPKIFITSLAMVVISTLGLLLFVIPGIYIMICFSLTIPIIIFQGDSIGEALSSCVSLIKNNWWKTFGFLIILSMIAGALQFVFQLPMTIYQVVTAFHMVANEPIKTNAGLSILFSIIQSAGSCFMQAIPFIGIGLLYFSLIEQKQNSALLNDLESIGGDE